MEKVLTILIKDRYIGGMLKYIQEITSDYKFNSPPHITIRGPYIYNIRNKTIDKTKNFLFNLKNITLSHVDYFKIRNKFVIYIAVQNNELRKIFHKRDFPIKRSGYNPHVTICKTSSFEKAQKLIKILNGEEIKFVIDKNELQILAIDLDNNISLNYDYFKYASSDELNKKDECYSKIIKLLNLV